MAKPRKNVRTFNSRETAIFDLTQNDVDDLRLHADQLACNGRFTEYRQLSALLDAYQEIAQLRDRLESEGYDSLDELFEQAEESGDFESERDELKRDLEDAQVDLDEAKRELKRTEDYDEVADELEDTRHKLAELRDRVDRPCKGCGQ